MARGDERDGRDEDDRPRRRRREYDGYEPEERRPPQSANPGSVKAAGVIWVVAGSLMVLPALVSVFLVLYELQLQWGKPTLALAGVVLCLTPSLFGLIAGIRTLSGRAAPVRNGVASLLFGFIYLGVGGYLIQTSQTNGRGIERSISDLVVVVAGIVLVSGGLLLLAGVLSLIGRTKYARYRAEQTQRPRRADDIDGRNSGQ